LHIDRLFLAVGLKQIWSQMPENRLEKQIQILLFATDFEVLKTEVDLDVINIRFGWPGVAWLLSIASKDLAPDSPNYQKIGQTHYAITERHKFQFQSLQLNKPEESSMQLGPPLNLVGIGLMESLWPGILSGNYLLYPR